MEGTENPAESKPPKEINAWCVLIGCEGAVPKGDHKWSPALFMSAYGHNLSTESTGLEKAKAGQVTKNRCFGAWGGGGSTSNRVPLSPAEPEMHFHFFFHIGFAKQWPNRVKRELRARNAQHGARRGVCDSRVCAFRGDISARMLLLWVELSLSLTRA